MMNNFKLGARVGVLENGEIRKGTIKNAYYDCSIAIVAFEEGNVEKVPFSNLGLLPEEKAQDNQEPREKSEITITPRQFEEISIEVLEREGEKGGPILKITGAILFQKLFNALFLDEGEND